MANADQTGNDIMPKMTPERVHICWIDQIYNGLPNAHFSIIAIFIVSLFYSISMIPLLITEQYHLLIESPFILGSMAMMWGYGYARWVTLNYIDTLHGLEEIIDKSSHMDYCKYCKYTLGLMGSSKHIILIALTLWGLICAVWYVSWINYAGNHSGFAYFMPSYWYREELLITRIVSVFLFAFPVILLVCTGGWWLVLHVTFMRQICCLQFLPTPRVCLRRIKQVLRFSVWLSITWSCGTALFIYLYRQDWDLLSISWISSLALINLVAFILPIVAFRRKLLMIKEDRIEKYEKVIIQKLRGAAISFEKLQELYALEERVASHDRLDAWFLGWEYALPSIGSIVIPTLALILQSPIYKIFV